MGSYEPVLHPGRTGQIDGGDLGPGLTLGRIGVAGFEASLLAALPPEVPPGSSPI